MKTFLGVMGVGLAGLAGIVLLTGFHGGCGGRGHGHDPAAIQAMVTEHLDDMLDDLDATPAQRERIQAVKDRLLANGLAMRGARQAAVQEVLAQWKSDQPDVARLHALVDERVDAFRTFAHEAVDGAVEVHGTLTPEQRAKITKKAERRMGDR
jgi:periplasmic protein CpxP/Spy